MDYGEIKNQVRNAIAEVLKLKPSEIPDDAHLIDDLGGESLALLELVMKLEEQNGILIPDSEIESFTSVNSIADSLARKLGVHPGAAAEKPEGRPRGRITRFEDTPEFAAFAERAKSAPKSGTPYFVRHDSVIRDTSVVDGKTVLNFGSYNYLGMSGHPRVVAAAQKAAEKYGTSASGSRVLAGEKTLFIELEKEIASWKHTEDALVMSGGYATNHSFVSSFCNERDLILFDALSHTSITMGAHASASGYKSFPHNDVRALEDILKRHRDEYEKVLLVVEGVYSMDGDIAPIPEFVRLKKEYGLFLMVDEAHSGGVIGRTGGGVDEYFGLAPDDIDIKMGTLSKAIGTCGGYLASSAALINYLKYNMPGFVFTAGMSPVIAAAALESIRVIRTSPEIVRSLQENVKLFISEAKRRGFDTCLAAESPIIPIIVGSDEDAFELSMALLARGVFAPPAVYPAVPKGSARLRFCVCSCHRPEQIVTALDTLETAAAELGVNLKR